MVGTYTAGNRTFVFEQQACVIHQAEWLQVPILLQSPRLVDFRQNESFLARKHNRYVLAESLPSAVIFVVVVKFILIKIAFRVPVTCPIVIRTHHRHIVPFDLLHQFPELRLKLDLVHPT